MKKSVASLLCILIIQYNAIAQQASIQGILKDSTSNQLIKLAAISFYQLFDTSSHYYTLSDENGFFAVKNIVNGNYQLTIRSQGYKLWTNEILITGVDGVLNLGDIFLASSILTLENIKVKQTPFYLNADTLEYNADSYKLRQYANLQELLKKLPGIQIEKDGLLKVNGVIVQQILVDNKAFFGGNMQIALINLPAEIISKIQVYDEADGKTSSLKIGAKKKLKTLNIKIKENKKKGIFGDLNSGSGSDNVYYHGLNFNRFDKSTQLSIIAQKQNLGIQSLGTNFPDNITQSGRGNFSALSTNFRKAFGNSITSYGSYAFKNSASKALNQILYQNLLSDSSVNNSQSGSVFTGNISHDFTLNIEKNSPKSKIIIRPIFNISNSNSSLIQQIQQTVKNDTIYKSDVKNTSKGNRYNYAILASYYYKFKKEKRTLSFNFDINNSNENVIENNLSITHRQIILLNSFDQMQLKNQRSLKTLASILYLTPLKKGTIEFAYSYNLQIFNNNTEAFKFNENDQNYNVLDTFLSSLYKFTIKTNKIKIEYNLIHSKYSLNIGTLLQEESRSIVNIKQNLIFNQSKFNIIPAANLSYPIDKFNTIQFYYDGAPRRPSFEQLLPYTSTSDSLFIYKSNINLKNSFSHNFSITYVKVVPTNLSVLSTSLNFIINKNDIQSSTTFFPSGIQEIKFVNVNGSQGLAANFDYSFPLKKSSSQINFNLSFNQNRLPLIINGKHDLMRSIYIESAISLSKEVSDLAKIEFQSRLTMYELVNNLKNNKTHYFNQSFSGKFNFYAKHGWVYYSIIDFNFSGHIESEYRNITPLVSSSVGKSFFKKKACEVKLTVFDWFNRNLNISRISLNNTIQTIKTNSTGRIILLSLSYNFRNFTK